MTKQSKWAALLTFFAVFFLLAGILVPLLLITFGQDDIGKKKATLIKIAAANLNEIQDSTL